jgi:hypothetical protein
MKRDLHRIEISIIGAEIVGGVTLPGASLV